MTVIEIPPIPLGVTQKVKTILDGADHVQVMTLMLAAISTPTTVPTNVASVTLLASNANRKSARIFNDSQETLLVKEGAVATADDYLYLVQPGTSIELGPYSGRVDGIWLAADGAGKARIAERT